MASIQEYLDLIKNAIYGREVRQAIHDGIQQCYYDGKAGSTDLEARQRLDSVEPDVTSLKSRMSTAEGSISSLGSRMSTAEGDIDTLDARVDQIVAPSGKAPSAAEVADGRIVDGVTYDLIGDAIRSVNAELKEANKGLLEVSGFIPILFEQGSVNTNTGNISNNANYIRSALTPIKAGKTLTVYLTNHSSVVMGVSMVYYKSDGTFLSSVTNFPNRPVGDSKYTITPPANAAYLRFRYNKSGGVAIIPSEITHKMYDENSLIHECLSHLDNAVVNYGVISESGLDLNTGDFIKAGMWVLVDTANIPSNYPSDYIGRIISFTSSTDSTFGTAQVVFDNAGLMYYRYSTSNGVFRDWVQVSNAATVRIIRDNVPFNYGNITTEGLDLNSGDFVHSGIWAVNNVQYLPYHSPTNKRCRIISFSSSSDNSIYTYQIVIDVSGKMFSRFSTYTDEWTPWKSDSALHSDIAFKSLFIDSESFVNDETISYDAGTTNRVQNLIARYDAATRASGVKVSKQTLGKDASNTFDVYNYKVSNGINGKPVVLVVFGEHGNEANSAEVGVHFYQEVTNGVLTPYLKYVDFWVIPLMNPWGYEHKQRNNANDVNLNRDFPCEWNYYLVQHNKTGDYSLSQPETQYLYNLLVNNRNKILFMCNKHNTGSISTKINISEEDIVGYTATILETDQVFNNGLAKWQDAQVHETDPWIVSECNTDISSLPLIVDRAGLITDGSMDLFANSIGIHGSLLEVCGAATYSTDTPPQYANAHYQDLARLELDYIVNYIAKAIENNELLLSNDNLLISPTYRTRVQSGSAVSLNLTWEQGSLNTNTGEESSVEGRCRSSYGSIRGDRNIDLAFENNTNEGIGLVAVYYDSNQDFISSDTSLGTVPTGGSLTLSITPPQNASYVRFRVNKVSLTTMDTSEFSASAEDSAWVNVEQYWNGQSLINIEGA